MTSPRRFRRKNRSIVGSTLMVLSYVLHAWPHVEHFFRRRRYSP